MDQINFTLPDEIHKFLQEIAQRTHLSKSAVAKSIFLSSITNQIFPYLAGLYQKGEISIKHICDITGKSFYDVITLISVEIEDIECDPATIAMSEKISENLVEKYFPTLAKKQISFDNGVN